MWETQEHEHPQFITIYVVPINHLQMVDLLLGFPNSWKSIEIK